MKILFARCSPERKNEDCETIDIGLRESCILHKLSPSLPVLKEKPNNTRIEKHRPTFIFNKVIGARAQHNSCTTAGQRWKKKSSGFGVRCGAFSALCFALNYYLTEYNINYSSKSAFITGSFPKRPSQNIAFSNLVRQANWQKGGVLSMPSFDY